MVNKLSETTISKIVPNLLDVNWQTLCVFCRKLKNPLLQRAAAEFCAHFFDWQRAAKG
jgi:hypothetical protein